MKVFLTLAMTLVATSTFAQEKQGLLRQADRAVSGQRYGMAGCGLGSVIMGSESGFTQVFAATTNGTSGNQTFGITSGTSNCEGASGLRGSRAADYVVANRLQLETDIARGQGESIEALALISGCDSNGMAQNLQGRYSEIFANEPTNDVVADRVVEQLSVCTAG